MRGIPDRAPWLILLGVFLFATLLAARVRLYAEEEDPPGPGAPPPQAKKKEAVPIDGRAWKKLLKAVPHVLWEQTGKRRTRAKMLRAWTEAGSGAVALSAKQFAELEAVLRAGNPFTTEKKRAHTLRVPTGETLPSGVPETMPVHVAVSSKYKPGCGRSFPLIISCHGGPAGDMKMAITGSGTQFGLWSGYSSTIDCIVAAPALTGSKYGAREWAFLTNLIDELDRRFNVDRDRILLTGHSWGGILTWHIGPPHADTFCALAPFICAVNPGREHLQNARALPIYHVQGARDMKWMLDTGRARKKILDELDYEHVYRERPGGHVVFAGEVRRIATWFMERPRKLYASELVRTETHAARNPSDFWYWIRSETHTFRARAAPKEHRIDVDIAGPFEVFLHDDLTDLDEPFEIRRQGEVVWTGRVQRRLDFAIEHVRETGDHCRLFASSVRIP